MVDARLADDFLPLYTFRKYTFWAYVASSSLIVPLAKITLPAYSGQFTSIWALLSVFFFLNSLIFTLLECFILVFMVSLPRKTLAVQEVSAPLHLVMWPSALVVFLFCAQISLHFLLSRDDHFQFPGSKVAQEYFTFVEVFVSSLVHRADESSRYLVNLARIEYDLSIPLNTDGSVNTSLLKRMLTDSIILKDLQPSSTVEQVTPDSRQADLGLSSEVPKKTKNVLDIAKLEQICSSNVDKKLFLLTGDEKPAVAIRTKNHRKTAYSD